jgi:hypothetical protein
VSELDRVAYLLGSFRDQLIAMFTQDVIAPNGLFLSPSVTRDAVLDELARNPKVGADLTVVLLCLDVGDCLVDFIESVQTLRPRSGRVIVLSQDPICHGDLAIRWIRAGARDYLDISYPPEYLLDHMLRAINGRSPYMQRMELPAVSCYRDIFVVMPFWQPFALRDFHMGIVPACNHAFDLDLDPLRGDGHHGSGYLPDKVERMIDEARIVIAILSEYGQNPNRNVHTEVGYTRRRQREAPECALILLLRRNETLPSDLSGLNSVQYFSSADLAIHLFHLFGRQFRQTATPQ